MNFDNFDLKTSKIKERDGEEKTFCPDDEKRKFTYLNPTFLKCSSFI